MKRWRPRVLAAAFVCGTIALALAAVVPPDALVLDRTIRVIKHVLPSGGSGSVVLSNVTGSTITVGSITNDCGAAPAVRLANGSGSMPFTLAPAGMPGSTRDLSIECLNTLPVGMHRCTFTIRDTTSAPILDFRAVCETDANGSGSALPRNKAMLSFGNTGVGQTSPPQTVTVMSPVGISVPTLQLQVDNPSFLIGNPCQDVTECDSVNGIPGGSSVGVDVVCRPLAVGAQSGQLFAVGDNGLGMVPVSLSCMGGAPPGAVLTLTPPGINLLTPVEVLDPNTGSGTIQLQNAGSAGSLTIQMITLADNGIGGAGADWSAAVDGQCTSLPCDLGPMQVLNARLTFNPSNFGPRPARMIVSYTDPAVKSASADLFGSGAGATLELVSESVLDFGVLGLNMPQPKMVVLANTGTRPTTANLTPASAPFMYPASVLVPPGQAITTVTCQSATPTAVTDRTVTVSANDVITPPFDLTLRCDVRDTLVIAVPSSHDFTEVRTNGAGVEKTFSIIRVGSGAGIPFTAALDTGNPNMMLGMPTGTQTPADVKLTITPTMDGSLANTITITPSGMQPIPIPITGSVVTAAIDAPNVLSLGTFCVGQPTTPTMVTLKATGTATIGLPIAPAMQSDPSQFTLAAVSPSIFPAQLAAMEEAVAIVTPERGIAAGVATDSVVWTTDAGNDSTTVNATYVADGGAIAPDLLSFGEVEIRVVKENAQQVTLQNCDTTELALEPTTAPAPFTIVDQFPTLLQPGEKATFSVAFRPQEIGHVERDLVIRSTAGDEFIVKLIGDGIANGGSGDDDGGDFGTTSFYACNCSSNDPGGVLVIALAMMCTLRRRRRSR